MSSITDNVKLFLDGLDKSRGTKELRIHIDDYVTGATDAVMYFSTLTGVKGFKGRTTALFDIHTLVNKFLSDVEDFNDRREE